MKRMDILNWDQYFMALAHLSSHRSKDPSTQVGAVIVDKNNRVVSIGYNGFPQGCSDDDYPWKKTGDFLENKYAYVVHAELNAILNAPRSIHECKIYVSLFPCNECAKAIIQSGIKEIIYESDKHHASDSVIASKKMLKSSGISFRQMKEVIEVKCLIKK
ncbi:MAG: deoxycytidylate deaminase [Anaerorhabdus sp.]